VHWVVRVAALFVLALACSDPVAPRKTPPLFVVRVSADSNACAVEVALVALQGPGLAATRLVVALGATAEDTLQPGAAGLYWHETAVFIGQAQSIVRDTAMVPGGSSIRC
jgi:hypothetical protein